MSFFNKVKWILGILLVFFLVLMTNLIDRNNFVQVRSSITTIYEDRLIANDLIIKMLKQVHAKELSVADSLNFENSKKLYDADLQFLLTSYEKTKLTKEEDRVFNELKEKLLEFSNLRDKIVEAPAGNKSELLDRLEVIKTKLYALSDIQLAEGRNQMLISQRAVETVELFTQIEIFLLVLLAILIQVIVMYSPKKARQKVE